MTRDAYDNDHYRRLAQRQIAVGILAERTPIPDIAHQLDVDIDTVLDDLEAMEMIPPRPRPVGRHGHGCGTHAGYKRHRRRGESACVLCKDAASKYQADRKRMRGARHTRERAKTVAAQEENSMSEGRMRATPASADTPGRGLTTTQLSQQKGGADDRF